MGRTPAQPTRRVNRGRGHSYYLDGEKALGVTTILNALPKPALVGWAAREIADFTMNGITRDDHHYYADELIDEIHRVNSRRSRPEKMTGKFPRTGLTNVLKGVHWDTRDAAALKGTKIHELAAALADGQEVEVADEHKGHVESYLRFLDEWQPTDAAVELVVINRRRGYMGTADMLCRIEHRDLGRVLLDVKTSKSGIFPETGLQVVAYGNAETYLDENGEEVPMPEIDTYAALWVRADGYDLKPLHVTEDDFRVFLYVAEVARWIDGNGGVVGESLEV